jgi:hypothetical protein
MGFAAIVAGKEVAVGDTWEWRGNLLNIQDCGDLVATFKFEEVVDHEGERCARVTGTISNWPKGAAPEFRSELFFALDRGLPVAASFEFKSPARTEIVKTRIIRVEPPAAADAGNGK